MDLNDELFKTYVVIEFDSKCKSDIKRWLENKLKAPKDKNGAELLTKFSANSKNEQVFLHLSATFERFLKGAEEICLKKRCQNDCVRDFLCEDIKNFKNCDNENEFLSQAECIKIIENELNNLKHDFEETKIDESISIHNYDGIINQLRKKGLIQNVFAVHDKNKLALLAKSWYKNIKTYTHPMKHIPIEDIRDYFGESVSFYFVFIEHYTKALYPFALVGLLSWVLPLSSFTKFMICCVFNLIWNTFFFELWKRKSNELCYSWGIFDLDITDQPRAQFRGTPYINPINNRHELFYPKKKRTIKKYFVSYPAVAFAIIVAFLIMLGYYGMQHKFDIMFSTDSIQHTILKMVPSILYSFVVIPLNLIYKYLSIALTDWENHRTQTAYESNLTTKLFVFYFANSFMCLFYEAFFSRSYANLSNLLFSMLIVNALVNKLTEVFAPYLKKKLKKKILTIKEKKNESLNSNDFEVEKQAYAYDCYEGTYSDYVTIFEQYGYITLFSAVFPWISFAALINNIMEQRSDAFKYCHVNQRPLPSPSKGIGPWGTAFELLGLISVVTNLALIALHPDVREYMKNFTDTEYILFFVALEHILVILKISIMVLIPDESLKVSQAKQKYKYESLEALKNLRLLKIKDKRN